MACHQRHGHNADDNPKSSEARTEFVRSMAPRAMRRPSMVSSIQFTKKTEIVMSRPAD